MLTAQNLLSHMTSETPSSPANALRNLVKTFRGRDRASSVHCLSPNSICEKKKERRFWGYLGQLGLAAMDVVKRIYMN